MQVRVRRRRAAATEKRTWTSLPAESSDEHLPAIINIAVIHGRAHELSSDRQEPEDGSADVPRVVGRLDRAPGVILSLVFHGIGRRRRWASRASGVHYDYVFADAAGTAPRVTRLHYRLPARDWRGAAHPSTQRAAAAPRALPRLCRIDSFTSYTIIHRTGTTTTALPRERAARGHAPARAGRTPRRRRL